MNARVFAVIVTYFPDQRTEASIAILRPQVTHMVVVDNGSDPSSLQMLRSLAASHNFDLIENGRNYGIGKALNQAIAFGRDHYTCDLVALFDQDSLVSANFIDAMERAFRASSDSVYLVLPTMIHRQTGDAIQHPTFNGRLLVGQTSGSVLPVDIFSALSFREDMFIEYVDYEFCLRMALLDRSIILCPDACLYHEPGTMAVHSLFGIAKIVTFNSNPVRKYYSMRNAIWMILKYGNSFPVWARFTLRNLLHEVVGALLFEEKSCRRFACGAVLFATLP